MRAGIYRHYKGHLYRVLFTAWESTNGRPRDRVVVYASLERGTINVRTFEEFNEPLDSGKYRFEFLGEEL